MDDRALVAAMVRRDPAGLDGVYRRYADRLFAYCVMVLRDHEAAADAVQETFLLAAQRAGQLRDPERLRPWLYAIARHECLRLVRSRKRSTSLDEAGDVAAESVDAGAGVHARQLRELIGSASASLSPADREVIDLSVRHGLDAAEVGAVLGVSSNHAHARMSRARSQLQRALGALLVARSTVDCPTLRELRQGWGGQLTPLLRKRISRHIDGCSACSAQQREQLQPAALLPAYAGLAFAAAPAIIKSGVFGSSAAGGAAALGAAPAPTGAPDVGGSGAPGSGPAGQVPGTSPVAAGPTHPGLGSGGGTPGTSPMMPGPTKPGRDIKLGRDGFPQQEDSRSPWPRVAAAALLLLLLLLAGGYVLTREDETPAAAETAAPAVPVTTASAAVTDTPRPSSSPTVAPSSEPPVVTDPPPGPPTPSGPPTFVIAFTATVTVNPLCSSSSTFPIDVNVTATRALDTATLNWSTSGGPQSASMPVNSADPRKAFLNRMVPAPSTTWWVHLKARDGSVYDTTPKTVTRPC